MLRSVGLALLLLHASSALAAPTIVNGSFELPVGALTITTAGNSFTGWTVTTGDAATFATTATYNAATGNQLLFLPATNQQDSEVDQPLTGFVTGVDYEISYVICGYNAQTTAKDCSIEIVTFNHKEDTYDLTVPAQTTTIGTIANPWQAHSFTFAAEGASTIFSIEIHRANATTDAYAAFDAFTIRVVPKGTPAITLAGKKPRKPTTKKLYKLSGTIAARLPLETITITAGKSVQKLAGASSFVAKVRLKKGRTRITVTATDIAGTTSPPVTRVVVFKK